MKNISEKNNIMFNKQAKVSVITPSYNSSRYIEDTIKSVISQTYTNWEMIVVDDCSKDNTTKIVEEISKKDSRVKLIKLKPMRTPSAEAAAKGKPVCMETVKAFAAAVLEDINPRDSWRASKAFRQHIATVLAERGLLESIRLSGGECNE